MSAGEPSAPFAGSLWRWTGTDGFFVAGDVAEVQPEGERFVLWRVRERCLGWRVSGPEDMDPDCWQRLDERAEPDPIAAAEARGAETERARVVAWLQLPVMAEWNRYLANNPYMGAEVPLFAALVRDRLRSGAHIETTGPKEQKESGDAT